MSTHPGCNQYGHAPGCGHVTGEASDVTLVDAPAPEHVAMVGMVEALCMGSFDRHSLQSRPDGSAVVSYIDEYGAEHTVEWGETYLGVQAEDQETHAEAFLFEECEPEQFAAKMERQIRVSTDQARDIRHFTAAARTLEEYGHLMPNARTPRIDPFTGTLAYTDVDGSGVLLTGFTAADPEMGYKHHLTVRLVDTDGSWHDYPLVGGYRPGGAFESEFHPENDLYGTEPMPGWMQRGLAVEVNRRAGMADSQASLAGVLLARAAENHQRRPQATRAARP